MTTTDPFTEAARAEAERYFADPGVDPLTLSVIDHAMHMAEWARTHIAAQRAAEVQAAKAEAWDEGYTEATSGDDDPLANPYRYQTGDPVTTHPIDTEAYLSGRTEREMSDLAQAAKHAGPVDPPAQEPTDAEVLAALNADYAIRFGPRNLPADSLEPYGDEAVRIMRAALSAARAARRDEENR